MKWKSDQYERNIFKQTFKRISKKRTSLKVIKWTSITSHTFSKTVYLLLNTFMRFGPLWSIFHFQPGRKRRNKTKVKIQYKKRHCFPFHFLKTLIFPGYLSRWKVNPSERKHLNQYIPTFAKSHIVFLGWTWITMNIFLLYTSSRKCAKQRSFKNGQSS